MRVRVIGGAVILALMALLLFAALLPRMIDWNRYRPEVERLAGLLLGQPVAIDGRMELALFPVPTLVATDIRSGEAMGRPAPFLARFRSIDARLDLAALLRGQVRVASFALIDPDIQIVGGWEELRPLLHPPESADLTRVIIVGGRVSWLTEAGDLREINRIDLQYRAAARPAPGTPAGDGQDRHRLDGSFRLGPDAAAPPIRVEAQLAGSGTRRPFTLDLRPRDAAASAAALLRVTGALDGDGATRQAMDGRLRLDGPGALGFASLIAGGLLGIEPPPLPKGVLSIEAALALSPSRLTLNDLAVTLGEMRLAGRLDLPLETPAARPIDRGSLRLSAARVAGGFTAGGFAAIADPVAQLQTYLQLLAQTAPPPMDIDISAAAVSLPGGLLRDISLRGAWGGGRLDRLEASVNLPQGGAARFTGLAVPGVDGVSLSGRLALSAEDVRTVLGLLGEGGEAEAAGNRPLIGSLTGLVAALAETVPGDRLRALRLEAAIDAAPDRLAIDDLALEIDGSRWSGALSLVPGADKPGPNTARLTVTAAVDRINLSGYWPVAGQPDRVEPAPLRRWLTDQGRTLSIDADLTVAEAMVSALPLSDLRLSLALRPAARSEDGGEAKDRPQTLRIAVAGVSAPGVEGTAEGTLTLAFSPSIPDDPVLLEGRARFAVGQPRLVPELLRIGSAPWPALPVRGALTVSGPLDFAEIALGIDGPGANLQVAGLVDLPLWSGGLALTLRADDPLVFLGAAAGVRDWGMARLSRADLSLDLLLQQGVTSGTGRLRLEGLVLDQAAAESGPRVGEAPVRWQDGQGRAIVPLMSSLADGAPASAPSLDLIWTLNPVAGRLLLTRPDGPPRGWRAERGIILPLDN